MRYGAFCDERGKMLGDGTVYNTGDTDKGILVVTIATFLCPSDGNNSGVHGNVPWPPPTWDTNVASGMCSYGKDFGHVGAA